VNAPHPSDTAPSPVTRHRSTVPAAVVAVVVALAAGVLVAHYRATSSATSPQGGGPSLAKVGAPAPNGVFTTANGTQQTIASLRGHTTLVWLVAGGCASCAASIPAVAQHLAQLQAKGVRVLTLGLYGAFDNGKAGAAQLTAFGDAAAGTGMTRPGWTWAMPSEALSFAYDPSGNPDEYFLMNTDGYITYHNSVPVSSMPQLLAAAGTSAAHTSAAHTAAAHTTAAVPSSAAGVKATVTAVAIHGCRASLTPDLYYPGGRSLHYVSSWVRPFDRAASATPKPARPGSPSVTRRSLAALGTTQYAPWQFVGDNRVGGVDTPCGI
jgi:hypothetical protein